MDTIERSKRIELYRGDSHVFNMDNGKHEVTFGHIVEVDELNKVSYEEMLQGSVFNINDRLPNYDEDDVITTFLIWCDEYLFELVEPPQWDNSDELNRKIVLPVLNYTPMMKYKDVIDVKVFQRNVRCYVMKSSRPLLKKIAQYIKNTENNGVED